MQASTTYELTEEYLRRKRDLGRAQAANESGQAPGDPPRRRRVHGLVDDRERSAGSCSGTYEEGDGSRVTFKWTHGCFGDWEMTYAVDGDEVTWSDHRGTAAVRLRRGPEGHRGVQQRAVDARRRRVVSGGHEGEERKMGHSRKVRLGALLVLGATAAAMLATAASAGPPFRETIHDEADVRPRRLLRRLGTERRDRSCRRTCTRPHQSARSAWPGVLPPARQRWTRGAHESGKRHVPDELSHV